MGRAACLLVALVLLPLPATSAPSRPPAVLLLDEEPRDEGTVRALAWARERLQAAWEVEDGSLLPGLAWPDPSCDEPARGRWAARVRDGLREGTSAFYDETDEETARTRLGEAVEAFLEVPCSLAGDPAARSDAAAGAVLLLRLRLLAGHREAASDLGGRLLRTFGPDELAAVDVPPEVTAFLDTVRKDSDNWAVPLDLVVVPADAPLLVDGHPVEGGTAQVSRGAHVLTSLGPGGARSRRIRVEGPERVGLDLDLSSALRPGPEGALVALPEAPADLDRRLASATGRVVIRIAAPAGGGALEARVTADPTRRASAGTVLRVTPGPDRDRPLQAVASGPLVRRASWPWPWVTGAASAGLLAAGIVMNVQANEAARSVNGGANRLDDWRTRRTAAIACYALAAAAGAGSVVLAVLGRPGPEHVVLAPAPGGVSVGLRGTF